MSRQQFIFTQDINTALQINKTLVINTTLLVKTKLDITTHITKKHIT